MGMLALRAAPRRIAKPKADPRFVALSQQLGAGASKLKKHAPAAQKTREASASAKAPANERIAGAKANVVDAVKAAPTPQPQPASFKALLRAEIDKAMPKTLGDTEKFMEGGQSSAMKGSLGGNVDAQKAKATGPVDQATQKAPDPGSVAAAPMSALPAEATPAAPAIGAGDGMPPPASAAEVSLEQSKQDTANALQDEKIKPESLARANDPRFSAVAAAQGAVTAQANKAPAGFRGKETAVLSGARAQAGVLGKQGSLLLAGTRSGGNARVLARQQQQAAKEEAERRQVAEHIEAIFTQTRTRVETRLKTLDIEVSTIFDAGVDGALTTMKDFVDKRILQYKLKRYLSIPGIGLARWLADQALGLPDEVNVFFEQGRRVFQAMMDRLIDKVAALVELRLSQAKAEVDIGQLRIKSYVSSLPAKLKGAGDAAAKAVADRFAELSQSIDAKKDELAASLAQKYKDAFDKADEALKSMQDENKGLLQQFAEKLGEVVKALLEFKARLMASLKKGQDAIQLILDDPIGFLGNLIAAVKGGFNAFVANIWTHLKAGFMKWLFGSLAKMGITLPTDLNLPSILKLVLDVLGITYDKMRAKAVKLIGERAVGLIEKAVEYIRELVTGGPAKLWEKVKEDLGNLKAMVIDAIQDWLITTIIRQAVAKVVSMFNPAGAIVQAVIAIYNVVMFVIERAQQIMALVEAVVNSVYAIASGAIGGAISWIEKSLASAIPLVIGFLARLLGLGGISEKIKEFIKKVQAKVDAAIDKAIAKVVGVVKKLFGAAKEGARKLLNWWKKKVPINAANEKHTLLFDGKGGSARLVIRSSPTDPLAFLDERKKKLDQQGSVTEEQKKGVSKLGKAKTTAGKIKTLQGQLAAFDDEGKKTKGTPKSSDEADALSKELDGHLDTLAQTIAEIMGHFNLKDPEIDKIELPNRPSWELTTKIAIAKDYLDKPEIYKDKAKNKNEYQPGQVTLNKKYGEVINLGRKKKDKATWLGRRHIVSSNDMAEHYEKVLTKKPPLSASKAKLLLEQRGSIQESHTSPKDPPDKAAIQDAARARHKKFFNYPPNLFIGPQLENSIIQEALDTGKPGMTPKALEKHISLIKRGWALDGSFRESRIKTT